MICSVNDIVHYQYQHQYHIQYYQHLNWSYEHLSSLSYFHHFLIFLFGNYSYGHYSVFSLPLLCFQVKNFRSTRPGRRVKKRTRERVHLPYFHVLYVLVCLFFRALCYFILNCFTFDVSEHIFLFTCYYIDFSMITPLFSFLLRARGRT